MTAKNIVTINEKFASVIEGLASGEKYAKTFEGATGIITKYWNKGYGEAAKALGLGLDKPKALKAYLKNLLKGEGMHSNMYTQDKDGNVVIGVWGTKNLEDKTVEAVIDARGKETYPLVKDENGKTVKCDVIKPISGLTPKTIFTLILQNEAMKEGAVPFTEADGMAKYVNETEPTAENVPTGKHKPTAKKDDKSVKAA